MDESESWYSEYIKICHELEAAIINNQECQQSETRESEEALNDANVTRLNSSKQNAASNFKPDFHSTLNAAAPQESVNICKMKHTPMQTKEPNEFISGRVNSLLLIDRTKKRYQCKYWEKTFSCEYAKERHSRIRDICKKSFPQKPEFSCESENWYAEYVKICHELEVAVNNKQECQQSEEGNLQLAVNDVNVSRLNFSNQNAACNSKPDAPSTLNAAELQESLNIDKNKVTPMENKGPDGSVSGRVNSLSLIDRTKKRFQCKYCEKTFSCESAREEHSRTHTGEKRFDCDICNKAFSRKSSLSKHKLTHTGQKPFICKTCNKAFSQNSNLASHKRTRTGEKPFKCDICNKAFSQKINLDAHKLTHTGEKPFKCDICNKTFSRNSSLVAHKLTHTGEKLFICDICNKTFSQKGNLDRHKRTHSGEKPFICNICQKAFSVKSNFERHKRNHAE